MHPATVITIFYDLLELELIKFSLKTIFFIRFHSECLAVCVLHYFPLFPAFHLNKGRFFFWFPSIPFFSFRGINVEIWIFSIEKNGSKWRNAFVFVVESFEKNEANKYPAWARMYRKYTFFVRCRWCCWMMRKKYKSEKNAIHFSGVPLLTRDEPGLEQLISEHLSAAAKANNRCECFLYFKTAFRFASANWRRRWW